MSFRGCNASEFLQCILSDVALNASRANTFYASFKDISNTIDNQRISISGVDEDEEAVNLVKYQNGYNLASKMIQTLTCVVTLFESPFESENCYLYASITYQLF